MTTENKVGLVLLSFILTPRFEKSAFLLNKYENEIMKYCLEKLIYDFESQKKKKAFFKKKDFI